MLFTSNSFDVTWFFVNQWTFGYCIQISKDLDTISKSLKIFIQFFIGYPNTCTWFGIHAVICSWPYELLMSLRRVFSWISFLFIELLKKDLTMVLFCWFFFSWLSTTVTVHISRIYFLNLWFQANALLSLVTASKTWSCHPRSISKYWRALTSFLVVVERFSCLWWRGIINI